METNNNNSTQENSNGSSNPTDAVAQLLQQLTNNAGHQSNKFELESKTDKQGNSFENGLLEGKGQAAKEMLTSLKELGIVTADEGDPIQSLQKTIESLKTLGIKTSGIKLTAEQSKTEQARKAESLNSNTQTDEEKETYRLRAEASEREKARLQENVTQYITENEVIKALSNFNVYSVNDVTTIFNSNYYAKNVNGKIQVYTKSGDLVREASRNHEPATVTEVVAALIKDRPHMVRPSAPQGMKGRTGVESHTNGNASGNASVHATLGNLDGATAIELYNRFRKGELKVK